MDKILENKGSENIVIEFTYNTKVVEVANALMMNIKIQDDLHKLEKWIRNQQDEFRLGQLQSPVLW